VEPTWGGRGVNIVSSNCVKFSEPSGRPSLKILKIASITGVAIVSKDLFCSVSKKFSSLTSDDCQQYCNIPASSDCVL